MSPACLSPARRFVNSPAVLLAAGLVSACGSSISTSTAPSTLARCGVTLRASAATLPATGGEGQVVVTTERECAWSAASESGWLTITGPSSGQGDGSIQYRVSPNGDPVSRRAAIVLNDQRADITQAAATCAIRLRDSSAEFSQSGGSGVVQVEASSQMCTWTASADVSWITLTSAAGGKGTTAVNFNVSPTSGPPRNGTIRVGDQQFSVTQSEGCTYAIAPSSQFVPSSGGSDSISVSTASGCPWTGLSNVPWITVLEGATGSGPGLVRFTVAPTDGPPRTGTLVVAGQAFTVTQSPGCSYQVEPLAIAVQPGGGALAVTVQSAPGCTWSASGQAPWINLTGASSGSGNGTASFLVAASSGPARSGTVTVAGQTVTVNQEQGCSFAIAPESQAVPAAGGTGTVNVTSGTGCAWTAGSNVDWITVTQGGSGTGNGAVQFNVAATDGPARTGTLGIAERTFTVNQGEGCSATLAPERATVPAAGGSRTFDVRTGGSCSWSATANVPWITVASGASGTGNGTVRIEVGVNSGPRRTGGVTAAGQTFAVDQTTGCSVTLSASGQAVPAAGGTGTVGVTAATGCTWTAASDQPWITITSGLNSSGTGTVGFSVAPNMGATRTGTITIGGHPFTITQAGACTFAISPQEQAVPAAGGTVAVGVTAPNECAWTAAAQDSWISVTQGATGSGSGEVRLAVQPNSAAARVGTATIAGQAFTVNQASGCTYAIAPGSRSSDAAGGAGMFNVTTSGSNCPWTAVSQVPWITISGEASGVGGGKIDYVVLPNSGPPRTGTITVDGQVFTLNQSGK